VSAGAPVGGASCRGVEGIIAVAGRPEAA